MKLFQKLIKVLNKFKLMLIKYLLNGKEVNLTGDEVTIKSTNFSVDKNGNMSCSNGNFNGSITSNNVNITGGKINIKTTRNVGDNVFTLADDVDRHSWVGPANAMIGYSGNDTSTGVQIFGREAGSGTSSVLADKIVQWSLENLKKNFEKLENGLSIVNNTEIYKYHFKGQDDNDKKHIGFIIGKNYKYSSEITSVDKNGRETGVDLYSMIAVAYKAIQEQQKQIQNLQERIEKFEEAKNEKESI